MVTERSIFFIQVIRSTSPLMKMTYATFRHDSVEVESSLHARLYNISDVVQTELYFSAQYEFNLIRDFAEMLE